MVETPDLHVDAAQLAEIDYENDTVIRRCDMIGRMPQQILQTERITLVPLADEHLEWEVEVDSDPEVMHYLSGRASTREEVEASHAGRMAAAQKLDGVGRGGRPEPHAQLLVLRVARENARLSAPANLRRVAQAWLPGVADEEIVSAATALLTSGRRPERAESENSPAGLAADPALTRAPGGSTRSHVSRVLATLPVQFHESEDLGNVSRRALLRSNRRESWRAALS